MAEALPSDTAGTMLTGTMIVPANSCWYPPAVEPNDLLRVNFNHRSIDQDGLYLVEILDERGVSWRGCRRFAHAPTLKIDQSGHGDWQPIQSLAACSMRVAGYVEKVYRTVAPPRMAM